MCAYVHRYVGVYIGVMENGSYYNSLYKDYRVKGFLDFPTNPVGMLVTVSSCSD